MNITYFLLFLFIIAIPIAIIVYVFLISRKFIKKSCPAPYEVMDWIMRENYADMLIKDGDGDINFFFKQEGQWKCDTALISPYMIIALDRMSNAIIERQNTSSSIWEKIK